MNPFHYEHAPDAEHAIALANQAPASKYLGGGTNLVDLMRENLRRRDPEAHDEKIDRLLSEWLRGRPGAHSGDCRGRPVDVNARLP